MKENILIATAFDIICNTELCLFTPHRQLKTVKKTCYS